LQRIKLASTAAAQLGGIEDMATFEERKRGFEAKFARNEELRFKATARRNRYLALWAARLFGLSSPDAEAYVKEVIRADFQEPGDEDVIAKVLADFKSKGVAMTPGQLRDKLQDLMGQALAEIEADK
jgi:hypothetical protein